MPIIKLIGPQKFSHLSQWVSELPTLRTTDLINQAFRLDTWGLAKDPALAQAISTCNEVTMFLQTPSSRADFDDVADKVGTFENMTLRTILAAYGKCTQNLDRFVP